MTLTEFLLARIAEIETACARSNAHAMHDRMGGPLVVDEKQYGRVAVQTAWLVDECEAKRRLIAVVRQLRDLENSLRTKFGGEPAADDPSAMVLRQLALPYVDHPDYDDAWTR